MQTRHFVVREVDGDYQVKEIDPSIATAMKLFGITKGEYHSDELSNTFFYFCPMSNHRANELAIQLSQKIHKNQA
jgi:hypothetical protein